MTKIALLTTGGTISMKQASDNLAVPEAGGQELRSGLQLPDGIQLESIDVLKKPGAHLTFRDLIKLKEACDQAFEEGADGIVITHGTDTLEETSYFLDLVTNNEKPIIVTGAQKNLSELQTDSIDNMQKAILVAADPRNRNFGVQVVFADAILSARDAIKTHSSAFNTFQPYGSMGTLGYVANGKVIWHRQIIRREYIGLGDEAHDSRVEAVEAYLGADGFLIDACIDKGVGGIVLQTVGAGHVPEVMVPSIERALAVGIPVVATKRPVQGALFTNTYGFPGSESHLRELGVVFAEDLPTSKARVKLKVLLTQGMKLDAIRENFEFNYY